MFAYQLNTFFDTQKQVDRQYMLLSLLSGNVQTFLFNGNKIRDALFSCLSTLDDEMFFKRLAEVRRIFVCQAKGVIHLNSSN